MDEYNSFSTSTSSTLGLQKPQQAREGPKSRPDQSDLRLSDAKKCTQTFITHMQVRHAMRELRRPPVALYVAVEVDGNTTKTPNEPVLVGNDTVEWDEEILLPSVLSIASFKVYASLELGRRLINGELLCEMRISVGDICDRDERLQPLMFQISKDEPCSSLRVVTERRICGANEFRRPDPPDSDALRQLEQFTGKGHSALLRYHQRQSQRDLDDAITWFKRVLVMCPPDHPNRPAAVFDLARTKFVHHRANSDHPDIDVPISLYRDTLRFYTHSCQNRSTMALDLVFTLFTHFQRRGKETNKIEMTDLLTRIAALSPLESYPYRAGVLALQIAQVSVSVGIDTKIPQSEDMDSADLIQRVRVMLLNPSQHVSQRAALHAGLGSLLNLRFYGNDDLVDLHEAVSALEHAVELTPKNHADKPVRLSCLGSSLLNRFEHLADVEDLDDSIQMFWEAACLIHGHANGSAVLDNLWNPSSRRSKPVGDLAALDSSISVFEEAVHLTSDIHPAKPVLLQKLSDSLSCRFEYLSNISDVDNSISVLEEAVRLTADSHSAKPERLNNLWSSLSSRFERFSNLADLDKSILVLEEALPFIPNSHSSKLTVLRNLRSSFSCRFDRLGDIADMAKSILTFEEEVCLAPGGHPDGPNESTRFENYLLSCFERVGDLTTVIKTISLLDETTCPSPVGQLVNLHWFDKVGHALSGRFKRLGDLADLDESISVKEVAIRFTPEGHPDRLNRLSYLGNALLRRFERFGELSDITKSVSLSQEVVYLTPGGHPDQPSRLSYLGIALLRRFDRFGDLVDLDECIAVSNKAIQLTPDGHPDKPSHLGYFGNTLLRRFERFGELSDITSSISIHEEAVRLCPVGHPDKPCLLSNLGIALLRSFERLGDITDIMKSISFSEEAVHLIPDGHPAKPSLSSTLGEGLLRRFNRFGDLADITRSILFNGEAVRLTPFSHPAKSVRLSNLGDVLLRRFEQLGEVIDLSTSIVYSEEAVTLIPDDHPAKPGLLSNLGEKLLRRFERLGDLADIIRSISFSEEAVTLTPDDHPAKPGLLSNLGHALARRFEQLGNIADINMSIAINEQAVHLTPDDHPDKPRLLRNLGNSCKISFENVHDPLSLSSAISHFSAASQFSMGSNFVLFDAGRRWASSAQAQGDLRALLDAYTTTINHLPRLAWLGLRLAQRHRVLAGAANIVQDAAAAAVGAGYPELAVEWLEQGLSIVWRQSLQLRIPFDELALQHPELAHQFNQVSAELLHASSFDNIGSYQLTNHLSILDARSLEKEVQKRHELAFQWEKHLVEIRTLPGLDRFLLPKTIEQLAPIANIGPVVYLCATKQRCDALIIMAGLGSIIHVPLLDVTCQLLEEMVQLLFQANGSNLQNPIRGDDLPHIVPSGEGDIVRDRHRAGTIKNKGDNTPDDSFRLILAFLWNDAVKPVLDALGFANPSSETEKMTRIFWCPTGLFTLLPVHAAGLYPTTQPGAKLSDFAISSYIPTLDFLAASSRPLSHGIRLVAVSQPQDDGLPRLPNTLEEIRHIRTLCTESASVTLTESCGTVEGVMDEMANADWVHFACQGGRDSDNPLNSGFILSNGRRLRLLDLVRLSRHVRGGLAYLSVCESAQGVDYLPDESIHPAAGMLLAGYSGVIATMWSVRDSDAVIVARDVYNHLFRDGKVPDSDEAAEALHRAVQRLRDSGVPFSSWIPFVHFGR